MSNFREGNEVSWFVNNKTPSGRIIRGTVNRVSNNKVTVKNFRPMNDKPYATGRPTMNINRKNFINNVNITPNLFNNSGFQKRSALATKKRLQMEAQNQAMNGLSGMFSEANANARKYQQKLAQNRAMNGIPGMFSEANANARKYQQKLAQNQAMNGMSGMFNSSAYNQHVANAHAAASLVGNTTPRNFSKMTKTRGNDSWIKQRSNTELQSRINAARVGPKNLVNTGNNLRNGKVSSRVSMFESPKRTNGIYSTPVNTGSTMTIAQRKAAMGLAGGKKTAPKKTAPKKKPTKKPTKKATKKKVSGGRDSTSRMIPE
jgi:hypothetical protein